MIKSIIQKIVPSFLMNWYHLTLPLLGAFLYGFPSRKIKVIGITGTNGKSTTVNLTAKVLEAAGYRVASLSSIKFQIGEKQWPNTLKMTMPGRMKIQKFLKQAVEAECDYVVLEVSSEGIKQHRHRFVKFCIAVFTNLSPEHIESHGGFENYRQAKAKLFQATEKIHIINADDPSARFFLEIPAERKYLYGLKDFGSQQPNTILVQAADVEAFSSGISFKINNTIIKLKLLGDFNAYNALAAVCVGLSQEIDLDIIKKGLEGSEGIPGRMEVIAKKPFYVLVDYAVTPDALNTVYSLLKSRQSSRSNLICVLGACGGGRDRWKRPELGKIADQFCQQIILTNEDPYDEDPKKILNQIEGGVENKDKIKKILDRREAIREAFQFAKEGDTVIITGKGCEPWICFAQEKKIPWDDRKVAQEELGRLSS